MAETTDRQNRRGTDMQIVELGRRMTVIEETQAAAIGQLAENTAMTKRIETNTAEVVKAFNNVVGALQVLGWVAKAAKWGTAIAAFAAGIIYFVKTGDLPPSPSDINPKP